MLQLHCTASICQVLVKGLVLTGCSLHALSPLPLAPPWHTPCCHGQPMAPWPTTELLLLPAAVAMRARAGREP